MSSALTRMSVAAAAAWLLACPALWAASYTQSQLFDRILTEDVVLSELADQIESREPGSGFLRAIRNPQIRYSYGEDTDAGFDGGLPADEERDSWDVDVRLFPPNPYEVSASRADAEAGYLNLKATAQQYLSMKINRARDLWAELRFTTSMREDLEPLSAFWESAGETLSQAARENLNLGPSLISWQMDRFQFMEVKLDIDSRHRNALNELAQLAAMKPQDLKPVFEPLVPDKRKGSNVGFESTELLSQKMRVAQEQSRVAESKAENIPWLDHVQGSYGELNSDFERESWSVQVAVSLPVFSLLSGESSERQVILKAEEAALKLLEQGQQAALFELSETVDRKKQILSLYDRDMMPLVRSLQGQINVGGASASGSLDEQIKLADSILSAVKTYHVFQLELEQALIKKDALQGRIP